MRVRFSAGTGEGGGGGAEEASGSSWTVRPIQVCSAVGAVGSEFRWIDWRL